MRSRFEGPERRPRLQEALRKQITLQCVEEAISDISDVAEIKEYSEGSIVITQNADDNSIAFLISGSVDIRVNERQMAKRKAGQHVGEMSVIDPAARRSASVIAAEDSCIAWVSEPNFTAIANKHPSIWRALAVEIAERLRQRADSIRPPNEIPKVFIGSSSEARSVAKEIKNRFKEDEVDVHLWCDDVFGASEAAMESLEEACSTSDFAVLICTADDWLKHRGKKHAAPRDNITFELGLFMGAIGRKRTLIVCEQGKSIRLPSDLQGITYLPFSRDRKRSLNKSLDRVMQKIRNRISERGAR